MIRLYVRLLPLNLFLLLVTLFKPSAAQAQWPPFRVDTTFSHQDKLLSYQILFRQRDDISLNDFTVKIPIPAGTRFVKAEAPPSSVTSFDGTEISFSTIALLNSWQISFTLEITDPTQTLFETKAWLSWVGEMPGTYLIETIKADTTRQSLPWQRPGRSRLQLDVTSTSISDTVTYQIYPKNANFLRMWDLRIVLPIPAGSTFVSANGPPEFTSGFDGQSATFTTLEMPRQIDFNPLEVTISVSKELTTSLVTQVQAFWKNSGRRVGLTTPAEESTVSGQLVLQPHTTQILVADLIQDAAFPFYDLSAVAIAQEEADTRIIFHLVEPIGEVGQPLRYQFLIDQDCSGPSSQPQAQPQGWDYRVLYRHQEGKGVFTTWLVDKQGWGKRVPLQATTSPTSSTINIEIPAELLPNPTWFCWKAVASYDNSIYYPMPPQDIVPNSNSEFWLTQYQATVPITGTTTTTNSTTTK
jgi:hypothetical protein